MVVRLTGLGGESAVRAREGRVAEAMWKVVGASEWHFPWWPPSEQPSPGRGLLGLLQPRLRRREVLRGETVAGGEEGDGDIGVAGPEE